MRTATLLSFLALAASVTYAAPTSQNNRRDGVTCNAKYRGNLYLSSLANVNDTSDKSQRGPAITVQGENFLIAEGDPIEFQFDECTANGWNIDGREYGQLKVVSQGNYKCVGAILVADSDGSHGLQVYDCSGSLDGQLDTQWWYAYYHDDKAGGPYVTLNLSGNPNDDDHTFDLPATETFNHGGPYAQVIGNDAEGRTLNLYDITFT